jgi:hypothetical protein
VLGAGGREEIEVAYKGEERGLVVMVCVRVSLCNDVGKWNAVLEVRRRERRRKEEEGEERRD